MKRGRPVASHCEATGLLHLIAIVDWFVLRGGKYVPLDSASDGVIRSEVLPGLWLDPIALVNSDAARLLAVAQLSHGSEEHCNFIGELKRRVQSK
jgi:hypothetical protein